MELLQAQMKEDSESTEHFKYPLSSVLDPVLAALPLQVRVHASSHVSMLAAGPSSSLLEGEMLAHHTPVHTASTPSGTVPNNDTSMSAQAVPPPSIPVWPRLRGESPLSPPENYDTAPLTPFTNCHCDGKLSAKAKSKRPAIDREGSDSRMRKSKCSHK